MSLCRMNVSRSHLTSYVGGEWVRHYGNLLNINVIFSALHFFGFRIYLNIYM